MNRCDSIICFFCFATTLCRHEFVGLGCLLEFARSLNDCPLHTHTKYIYVRIHVFSLSCSLSLRWTFQFRVCLHVCVSPVTSMHQSCHVLVNLSCCQALINQSSCHHTHKQTSTHTRTHTHSLSFALARTRIFSLSLVLSLSHTHTHAHSHTHTPLPNHHPAPLPPPSLPLLDDHHNHLQKVFLASRLLLQAHHVYAKAFPHLKIATVPQHQPPDPPLESNQQCQWIQDA